MHYNTGASGSNWMTNEPGHVFSYCCSLPAPEGEGHISGPPLFLNRAARLYAIAAVSPCVDQGSATGAPALDFAGFSRPLGAGYDIGCYEYVSAPVGPVLDLAASKGTQRDRVALSWSERPLASGYVIWRGTNQLLSTASPIATLGVTNSYSDNTIAGTARYDYWIAALNGPLGESDYGFAKPAPATFPVFLLLE